MSACSDLTYRAGFLGPDPKDASSAWIATYDSKDDDDDQENDTGYRTPDDDR